MTPKEEKKEYYGYKKPAPKKKTRKDKGRKPRPQDYENLAAAQRTHVRVGIDGLREFKSRGLLHPKFLEVEPLAQEILQGLLSDEALLSSEAGEETNHKRLNLVRNTAQALTAVEILWLDIMRRGLHTRSDGTPLVNTSFLIMNKFINTARLCLNELGLQRQARQISLDSYIERTYGKDGKRAPGSVIDAEVGEEEEPEDGDANSDS